MEVLNAETVPVGDMVYRVIKVKNSLKETEIVKPPICTIQYDDYEDYDPDLPIVHEGNTFYITFHVPRQLFKHIIGSKHSQLQRFEQDGAKLDIQNKRGNSDGEITISGCNKKVVSDAYHRVIDKVFTFRFRIESTHFVSLPVNAPNIQESFLKFRETILNKKVRGIDRTIFQNPKKLHMTVAMLVLLDDTDCQNAIALLTKCKNSILKDYGEKEFLVQVKGIEYMNDDPSDVNVLYAKVEQLDGDNTLQLISDKIYKEFTDASLSKKQHEKVKLHITLMNTVFRNKLETDNAEEDKEKQPTGFDARAILRDFEDYDFGQLVISEIHISVRYTEAEDGYYKAEYKLKLSL